MCDHCETKPFSYDIVAEDPTTHARAGVLHTPHGDIPTPIFMPVGTKATVKGLLPPTLHELGTKILLANTYHLSMRPGADLVNEMGGLHEFMRWDGPILTDSGGFQVFSHGDNVKLSDDGVTFRAVDYDGSYVRWTPEQNMDIARKLGADIVMQLDQCPGYPSPRPFVERAVELSSMWAERCWAAHEKAGHLNCQGTHRRCSASCRAAWTWTCACVRCISWSRSPTSRALASVATRWGRATRRCSRHSPRW